MLMTGCYNKTEEKQMAVEEYVVEKFEQVIVAGQETSDVFEFPSLTYQSQNVFGSGGRRPEPNINLLTLEVTNVTVGSWNGYGNPSEWLEWYYDQNNQILQLGDGGSISASFKITQNASGNFLFSSTGSGIGGASFGDVSISMKWKKNTTVQWATTKKVYSISNKFKSIKLFGGLSLFNTDFSNARVQYAYYINGVFQNNYQYMVGLTPSFNDPNYNSSLFVTNYKPIFRVPISDANDNIVQIDLITKAFITVIYATEFIDEGTGIKTLYNLGETVRLSDIENYYFNNVLAKGQTTDMLSVVGITKFPRSQWKAQFKNNPANEIVVGAGFNNTIVEVGITSDNGGFLLTEEITLHLADYIAAITLSDYKQNYNANELVKFSANTKLTFYNQNNEIVSEFVGEAAILGEITTLDSRYGQPAQSISGGQSLRHTITGGYQVVQTIFVTYLEEISDVVTTQLQASYIVDSDGIDLTSEFNKVVVFGRLRENTNTQNIVRTITIPASNYYFDPFEFELADMTSNTETHYISVFADYFGSNFHAEFPITLEKQRATSLVITGQDSSIYYRGRQNKFVLPNGLVIKKQNNDGTQVDLTGQELTQLKYRTSANTTTDLVPNSSVIASGSVIYVFLGEIYGFYVINWQDDSINAIQIQNETPFNFILGNSFVKYRNNRTLKFKALFDSGFVQEEFLGFTFSNNEIVLTPQTNVSVFVDDEEFVVNLSGKVTFTSPSVNSIEIQLNGVSTNYNNLADKIDLRKMKLLIKYINADYIDIISKEIENQTAQKGKFTASAYIGAEQIAVSDNFNGGDFIDLPNEFLDQTQIAAQIKLAFREFFSNDLINDIVLEISIFNILEILGISLIGNPPQYHIGDSFLNDNDETEVAIHYENSAGNHVRTIVKLNSNFSSLSVLPAIGTVFNRAERAKTIRIVSVLNSNVSAEYTISVLPRIMNDEIKQTLIRAVFCDTEFVSHDLNMENRYILVPEADTKIMNNIRVLTKPLDEVKIYGYLTNVGDTSQNSSVIMFDDYVPPLDGESNITVKFPCFVEGNAGLINKCRFGKLFGNSNSKNRLFLAGNPDIINCDWHSSQINDYKQEGDKAEKNGNFTYFSDLDFCFYGQTDNAIIGYDIVSNDKMVVFKGKSDKEPTTYYRANGLIKSLDNLGQAVTDLSGNELYQESYPLIVGNSGGDGAVDNHGIINFNGDTLFISSNKQINGLDNVGQIGDNQRVASVRSKYIDKIDFTKAQLWSNNTYLFAILENEVYVTHFETHSEGQYEWWRFNIKNISAMIEWNNKTYFATRNGEFCVLENGIFQDKRKLFTGSNGAMLVSEGEYDDTVQVSQTIIDKMYDDVFYTFKVKNINDLSKYRFSQIGTISNSQNSTTDFLVRMELNALELVGLVNGTFDQEQKKLVAERLNTDSVFYLNSPQGSANIETSPNSVLGTFYRPYKLRLVGSDNGELFELFDITENKVADIKELYRATLCQKLDGEYTIYEIDREEATFKLKEDSIPLNLVRYANQPTQMPFEAEITEYVNVTAYYITAPFTMGSLLHNKLIKGWALTNDTDIVSEIEVAMATNEEQIDKMTTVSMTGINQLQKGYNLYDFSFNAIDFEKRVIPTVQVEWRWLRVNFICFGFRNLENTNSVLSSLQIVYTISGNAFGKE